MAPMLTHIPTHLVAGPLGAGKTSLIRHLLAQCPMGERWAVLINEFGQVGLDAALLETGEDGISLAEVAGGCLCCVNGAPFQVGLGRLLRKARPDRLFIEPSGLGHPAELRRQLVAAPWTEVLALQPTLVVLDAQALARGEPLPVSQQAALEGAGLLVLNKAEGLQADVRQRIVQALPGVPQCWTEQGQLPLERLPGLAARAGAAVDNLVLPSAPPALATLWTDPTRPVCQAGGQGDGWSIGWRWHPSQRFDPQRLAAWLQGLDWRRAKLVIHSAQGWVSANALDGAPLHWRPSEWRRDSRLELIFSEPQDEAALSAGLEACRLRE